MTTQVSFTADPILKRKALEKAKYEGVTLKTILIYSMKAYDDGKIGLGIIANDDVQELFFKMPE